KYGVFTSKKKRGTREGEEVYKDYFEYSDKWFKMPAHRVLACLRGAQEGFLNITVDADQERIEQFIMRKYQRGTQECLEEAKHKADLESIAVFGANLKQLLLAAPLGNKRILAIDPGYRTGCKVVCLNEQGDLLHNETIYPHPPQKETGPAMKKIRSL